MKYSESLVAAFLAHATTTAAQEWFFFEDGPQVQFEIRSFDDGFNNYDPRSIFEDGGYYSPHELEARDYGHTPDEQSLAVRSLDSEYDDQPLEARAVFLIQADHPPMMAHNPLHQMISSLLQPAYPSPMESFMNVLSTPAHRDHPHLLFNPAGHSSIMIPPQRPHDPFDHFFNPVPDHRIFDTSFDPDFGRDFDHDFDHDNDHDNLGAHVSAHISSSGSGTTCTSSTFIGPDGIPKTTKECTTHQNGQPVSHMSVSSNQDTSNRVFNGLFGNDQGQKVMRNKRILELDGIPQRGEIHTYHKETTPEFIGHGNTHGGDDEHHDDTGHIANVEKHDLRDEGHDHHHDLHVRDAEPAAEAEAEHEEFDEQLVFARDAEAEAEPEPELDGGLDDDDDILGARDVDSIVDDEW